MRQNLVNPRITLEQWRCLVAVVEEGGFAQAAEALNKSQSTVSYAVNKLQDLLGIPVLEVKGRKAELTQAGAVMYRRARQLLTDAASLEALVEPLRQCWEPELRVALDAAFPVSLMIEALREFEPQSQGTRVILDEVILSGAEEALEENRAELAIAFKIPQGYLGDHLLSLEFLAVAHPDHPVFSYNGEVDSDVLARYLQVVIKDSGRYRSIDTGWLKAERRWTVSNIQTAINTVVGGLGFAWLPVHDIQHLLDSGRLKPIPLLQGGRRVASFYLVFGHPEYIGPATRLMADTLHRVVENCPTPDVAQLQGSRVASLDTDQNTPSRQE